ncbi:MAG TPA: amidohydrolase family protein, partial [Methanospirillum sp.]|nr:amidohydrolase family protein [Methanospirillum sp.]
MKIEKKLLMVITFIGAFIVLLLAFYLTTGFQSGIKDMIGADEMEIAEKYGLPVLLHLPRKGRLADPDVQKDVQEYARMYPNTKIVLAHCGRCYHPDDMLASVSSIKDIKNVYLDTAMVMEPMVLQILFSEIDSSRIVFGTDIPIAMMRGRRVYVK